MKAIINGKVIASTENIIEKGTVLIDGTKIVAVGENVEIPEGCEIIDATGKWVTPGFIDAHNHICAMQEPSAGMGMDGNEVTDVACPNVSMVDAIDPRNLAIPIVRAAGFTTVFVLPGSANVIGGTGTAMKLHEGETIFDLIIPDTLQMKMALGENPKRVYGSKGKKPSTRMGIAAVLRENLYNAKNYSDELAKWEADNTQKKPAYDDKLQALVPVVRGEMKCRIHCHRNDDIVTAIRICEEFGLKFSIEHVTEGYMVKDFLAKKNPDMVVGPLIMPLSKMEIWNQDLKNPALLEAAGCDHFCLMEDSASQTEYLPMHIGLAISRGLSWNAAFRAVTINPANNIGLGDRLGTLEAGKDADIAIWTGDPFCNYTLCENTIIDGRVYENAGDRH